MFPRLRSYKDSCSTFSYLSLWQGSEGGGTYFHLSWLTGQVSPSLQGKLPAVCRVARPLTLTSALGFRCWVLASAPAVGLPHVHPCWG